MIKKFVVLCSVLFAFGCTSSSFYGVKVVGKSIDRYPGQCVMAKGFNAKLITGKDINCICSIVMSEKEKNDVYTTFNAFGSVNIAMIYLADEKFCDPTFKQ